MTTGSRPFHACTSSANTGGGFDQLFASRGSALGSVVSIANRRPVKGVGSTSGSAVITNCSVSAGDAGGSGGAHSAAGVTSTSAEMAFKTEVLTGAGSGGVAR